MSTVASLQIKIGADVSAAISGLSRAEFAADQVKEAYIAASAESIKGGFAIAGWATNFSTAIGAVKRDLEQVDITQLDEGAKESRENMLALATGALRVSDSVTVAASAFSGMQAIAGPALAGIARLIPSIGVQLAALAGPIGIAVGALAAGAALVVSNWDLVANAMSDVDSLTLQATNSMVEQDSKMRKLVSTINDNTKSYKERSSALKEAQSISDTYFGALDLEKSKVEDVTGAYDGYIKNLKNASLAKVIGAEIDKEQAKLIELEKTFNKRLSSGSGFSVIPGVNINDLVTGSFDGLNKDVQSTTKNIDDLTKRLAGIEFTVDQKPTGTGTKGAESDADKIKKIYEKLGNDIAGLQTDFGKGIITGSELDEGIATLNKKAIDGIQSIDPKSDFLVPLYAAVAQFISDTQKTAFNLNITPKIDTSDFTSQVDTIRSNAFEKLEDIDLKFKFTGSGEDALKEKISAVQQALQELGTLNVPVDDDAVQILLAELAILKSQTDKPFLIDVQVKDLSFAERFKKEIEGIQQALEVANQIGSALSGALGQSNDNEFEAKRQALDAYYERESELIESSISNDKLKNSRKEQLDKEVAQKRKQIARQEALSQKNLNIFEATINTANAVTRALATGGPILAGVVGALGLAQIAAIASAPLPALAGGALVTGPSFVQVGEYPGAAQNPEFISPVDKAQKYIREAVQQAGGGGAQQLYSFVSGDDIVLVSDRANYRKQRLG